MDQKNVYKFFAQKLGFKQMSLQNIKLSDGKVYVEYFKQIFQQLNQDIVKNRYSINPTEEFSSKSKHPWNYLNTDATLLDFARLLSIPASRSAANIRAECTRPCISKKTLTSLLADQLEVEINEIDLEMKVRNIRLPLANYNKHSWLTFIRWCEKMGFNGHPENLDKLAEMSVNQLFDCWAR